MIHSATDTEIRIGDAVYDHALAVSTDAVIDDWPATAVEELVEADFAGLLNNNPAIIVLGTGTTNIFPPRELVFALARRGVGLETMDTPAAARTYNVLASEGRQVAAVFYL